MPHTLIVAVLFAVASNALADSGTITVVAKELESDAGQVIATLHASKQSFPGREERAMMRTIVKAEAGVTTLQFHDVPYGDYAVALYHDADGNGKMKTAYGMIPLEGLGVSNDAQGVRGPPKYEDAKFSHQTSNTEIVIRVNY